MHWSHRPIGFFAWLVLTLALPITAHASGDGTTTDGDASAMKSLTCAPPEGSANSEEVLGTYPPCPVNGEFIGRKTTKPITFKDTPARRWAGAVDPKDKKLNYKGTLSRGTPGDADDTFSITGTPFANPDIKDDGGGKGEKSKRAIAPQNACVNQIDIDVSSVEDRAKLERLRLDQCTNQYILHSATPEFRQASNRLSGEDKSKPEARARLKDHCQSLNTLPDKTNEYNPAGYLSACWDKVITNVNHRKTPGAPQEPAYPSGLKLVNSSDKKLEKPTKFPTSLAQLAANQDGTKTNFEAIYDPCHPFSPRWDYKWNEREHYSPMTDKYSEDTKNSVYCAGNRGDSGDNKKDKIYKVDVMEFRRDKFEKEMVYKRILFNEQCYRDVGASQPNKEYIDSLPKIIAESYCYVPILLSPKPKGKHIPCWKCFGLTPEKKAKKDQSPPCATRYDGTDQSIKGFVPGALNLMKAKAHCYQAEEASKVCKDLRAPVTMLNVLKLRYHNPGATEADKENDPNYKENDQLPSGVPEGWAFNDYFRGEDKNGRMPYMRWPDTGRSDQKTARTDQDPMDVKGQYSAIVGIGREADPKAKSASTGGGSGKKEEDKTKDQRCLIDGWGGDVSFGGITIKTPDPITSWTGLKLAQARTTREVGLVCLGRYEKVFKPRSSESQILTRAGAEITRVMVCEPSEDGPQCVYSSDPEAGSISDKATYQYVKATIPLPWRGYASDKETPFPSNKTGLDNAQCGDILLLNADGKNDVPKLAYVVNINLPGQKGCKAKDQPAKPSNCEQLKNCSVTVEEADNGRWPDVCGTTEASGALSRRTLFKPGHFPKEDKEELDRLDNWKPSCNDPGLLRCEMDDWDTTKIADSL